MSKASASTASLPAEAQAGLKLLGERLRGNRIARGWTVIEAAKRLMCSPTTLSALESGRPGTSMGLLMHALWLYGQLDSIGAVAPIPPALVANRRVRRGRGQAGRGRIQDEERDF